MDYDSNSLPDLLPIYYKRIFPYAPYYRWLNYGGGKFLIHVIPQAPQDTVLGEMRKRKCGMTLIGRGVKPRDRCHSADYLTKHSTGNAVKCRTTVLKMLATTLQSVIRRRMQFTVFKVASRPVACRIGHVLSDRQSVVST